MWYTMEFYSAIERKEILSLAAIRDDYVTQNKAGTERQASQGHMISLIYGM
jgi:hypothetical protein